MNNRSDLKANVRANFDDGAYEPLTFEAYKTLPPDQQACALNGIKRRMEHINPDFEQDVFEIIGYNLLEKDHLKVESLGVLGALFKHSPKWGALALDRIETLLTDNMWPSRSLYIGAVVLQASRYDPKLTPKALDIADRLSQYKDPKIQEAASELRGNLNPETSVIESKIGLVADF